MDINIIAGKCGEINNKYIFSLLKNRDKTKNHIIIAPDRSLFTIEQRLFEETGEKCFFDINVISLSRLTKSKIKKSNKNILTKQSGIALIKKILKDNQDKLLAFNKAISHIGFASSLFETICFYKSCNVSYEDIFTDDSTSFSNLKQKDIKLVYSEYEKYLKEDYIDSFNQLKVFADMIDKETFSDTIFYLLEFDDFTRLMYNIILKVAKFSEGIYICCNYGKENNNSNIYSNKVYYDLIDIFKSEGLNYKINKLSDFDDNEKSYLCNNLLSYSTNQKEDTKDSFVDIKVFNNIEDEVKFVLGDIYSKLILEKEDLSKFAIVVPSLDTYEKTIINNIKNYELSYYLDKSDKLSNNYLIRLIFDICVVLNGEYRLSDFSAIIKSPLLNLNTDSVLEYDKYLKRIGAISNMCLKEDKLDDDEIKEFIALIRDLSLKSKQINTYSECIEIINQIFNYISNRSEVFVENLDTIQKRTYDQVLKKFENINNDILGVFNNVEISFKDFLDIYYEYFDSTNISLPPISSNTLFIADFNSSYLSNYDYMYILGNNEGKLPSLKLDNGLLSDDELLKLPNASKLTPTVAMLNARKVFKLFNIIFKANKFVYLSYVLTNNEGKLYPNNLLESFKKLGYKIDNNFSSVLDVLSNNYTSIDINNVVFNNLTKNIVDLNLINYLNNWDIFNNNINFRNICTTLYSLSSDKAKCYATKINNPDNIKNLTDANFLSSGITSISQLETYNRCPYIYYIRYGLNLKDSESSKLKPNDIGNIIHEVLRQVVPQIVDSNIEEIKNTASDILNKVLLKDEYREMLENVDNIYIIKSLYREVDRVVVAIYNEINSSNFKPKYYEYRFNNIECNGIKIKGFIDRVDTYDDGFVIIDYKTGDNHFKSYTDVYSGKKLQLLVYAKAFENLTGLKSKAVFYMPISNGFNDDNLYNFNGVMLKDEDNIINMDTGLIMDSYKSNIIHLQTTSKGKIKENNYYKYMCLDRVDFDYLLDFTMKQVDKTIKNILSGNIIPRPIKEKGKCVCDYCDYKALCNHNTEKDDNVISVEDINKLKELDQVDGGI